MTVSTTECNMEKGSKKGIIIAVLIFIILLLVGALGAVVLCVCVMRKRARKSITLAAQNSTAKDTATTSDDLTNDRKVRVVTEGI